jgi:hypothetical protein
MLRSLSVINTASAAVRATSVLPAIVIETVAAASNRCVVDAVADHRHFLASGLQVEHVIELVLWRCTCHDVRDAKLVGNLACGCRTIA